MVEKHTTSAQMTRENQVCDCSLGLWDINTAKFASQSAGRECVDCIDTGVYLQIHRTSGLSTFTFRVFSALSPSSILP